MGREKVRRAVYARGGIDVDISTASTGSDIGNEGFTHFTNGTSGSRTYTMEAPHNAGQAKELYCTAVTTSTGTDSVKIKASSSGQVTFDGTNHVATFNAAGDAIQLRARSTAAWAIVANVGSVSLGTS